MQVRIGAMDGIFLAYHSGEQIFGFEYLPLEELDKYISGSFEESQQAFQLCLGTLETMLERAVTDIPGKVRRIPSSLLFTRPRIEQSCLSSPCACHSKATEALSKSMRNR
jgi:hypothetical protein